MNNSIKKEIFLDELPRYKNSTKKIDFTKSIGYKVKFLYNNIEGEVEILDFNNDNNILTIKYEDKEPFLINTAGFRKCAFGKLLGVCTNDFKINIGQHIKDDSRDIEIIDRKYIPRVCNRSTIKEKYYEIYCNRCGTKHWVVENSILKLKTGCPCCAGKVVVEGINDIPTTTPWMVKYFQGGYDEAKLYNANSSKKLNFKCPICGTIKSKSINIYTLHNVGFSCEMCSDGISYPEKILIAVLNQLKLKYEHQYHPDWIGRKLYDFYIPKDNHIIEAHGRQHYEENTNFKMSLKEVQENDLYKKQMAEKNGITNYTVIDCRYSDLNYIKTNIISSLSEYYDLSKIDWLKCEKFATNSLIYEVGEYYSKNTNLTPQDLAEIFNMTNTTIRTWLKKANSIGICNYNPKITNSLGGFKSWETRRRNKK